MTELAIFGSVGATYLVFLTWSATLFVTGHGSPDRTQPTRSRAGLLLADVSR
jgi:hypothetical protein